MAKHQDVRPGHVVQVARALADQTRLRVLCALRKGELCVCQITELPNAQAAAALRWALEAFGATGRARADERELRQITRRDPELLCRRQRRG